MMQDVSIDKARKELRTIEIGSNSETVQSAGNNIVDPHSNFAPDISESDDDEASEVRLGQLFHTKFSSMSLFCVSYGKPT